MKKRTILMIVGALIALVVYRRLKAQPLPVPPAAAPLIPTDVVLPPSPWRRVKPISSPAIRFTGLAGRPVMTGPVDILAPPMTVS